MLKAQYKSSSFCPLQYPLKILIFPSCPRRKNIILTCKVKNHKDIQTYARGRVIFIISLLFLTLRNSRNVIKYFGQRYVPGIQWWGSDPTIQISLQDLSGIKSPLVFSSLYKGSWILFPPFFITVHNLQSIQTFKLTNHHIVRHTFKKTSKILKNYEDQFAC